MENSDYQVALDYHNGTKHPYGPLMNPNHRFNPAQQPLLFKVYKDLEPIPLTVDPAPRKAAIPGALGAISGDVSLPEAGHAIDLPVVSRLLYFSAGITKTIRYPEPWGEIPFRAAACTGALYHIELYIACGDLPGLPAGVYHFDPRSNGLHRLRQGDYRGVLVEASGGEPAVAHAPATLVLTDVVWRNAVKYQAREYRHTFWDSGTILANTLAVAAASGIPAKVVLGFADAAVSSLLDIDSESELALALVPIGTGLGSTLPPAPPVEPLDLAIEPYSPRVLEFPPVQAMHVASSLPDGEAAAIWRGWSPAMEAPVPAGPHIQLEPLSENELPPDLVEAVIVRRGSTRQFSREPIGFKQLSTLLDRSNRGFDKDFARSPGSLLNQAYLIVNAVEGLESGAYVYHRELGALEMLQPGDFRATAGYLGLNQDLAADASVDIFFMTDLQVVLPGLGNRGYRAAQLEASISAGRIYLAAYALGFGASGLTFYDDAVTEFFSPHASGKSVMFLVAIGVKRKRS